VGLAAAARARARARRRTRLAGLAAVVALGVGVPAAVLATHGSRGPDAGPGPAGGQTAVDPAGTQAPGLRGGYHFESWADVSVAVPDSWGYGDLASWCAAGGSLDTPRVNRPGDVAEDILCNPATGYGLTFQPLDRDDDFEWPVVQQTGDGSPKGAYVGGRAIGGTLVTVVTHDSDEALYILSTMQRNKALDPNGCPVYRGSDPVVPGAAMTVCRYDASGLLEQSELLVGADVDAAEAALRGARSATTVGCVPDVPDAQQIRMASLAEDAEVSLGCRNFSDHGLLRQLTPAVLYWALSPGWSGSVPDGVSLPSVLRSP
jgi:hypothetical protein